MIRALPACRPRRRAVLPVMLLVAALGMACTTPTPSPMASGAPSSASPGSPAVATGTPTSGPTGTMTTIRTYFYRGTLNANGGLVPVERQVSVLEPAGSLESEALVALIEGPNATELGAIPAMYSQMPEGTRVLELSIDVGIATVDLSGEFAGGGSASAKGRLAQVVYTLTQFPAITSVRFKIDGKTVTTFTDAALDLSEPVDRMTYTDQLPAIFVDRPAWSSLVANPMHLTGLSDVFEATFRVRIVDAAGHALVDGQVMATCGSGCWGGFDETIPYLVAGAGPGKLQAYEPSAADGSPTNITEYPVTLAP